MSDQHGVPVQAEWARHLAEQVADFICVCRRGIIDYINPAGARLLGFDDPARLVGRPLAELVRADYVEQVEIGFDSLAVEGVSQPLVFLAADGRAIDTNVTARVISGDPGRPLLVHAVEAGQGHGRLISGEESYRRLVDLAHDCICVCSDGRVSFINAAGVRLLGARAAADLIGRPLAELVDRDHAELVTTQLQSLCAASAVVPVRLRGLDGRGIDVELTAMPFGSAGGNSYMIEARDVSAVKSAAEALREREQRLQGIVDTVGEGIITADQRGVIQSFNPAATRIFGYTAAEAIGQPLQILMPPPYHGEHGGYLSDFMHSGKSKVLGIGREVAGRRKDGSDFPLELNVAELRRGDQRLFIGIVRDITERKRVEEALRRARDELEERVAERTHELQRLSRQNEQILNSAGEGIIGLDVGGLITFVNPSAAEMTGWKVVELVGRRAVDVLHYIPTVGEGGPGGRPQPLRGGVAASERETTDLMLWRRDGTSFPVEFALAPIEEAGEAVGAVIVFRDITERKRTEEKLRLAAAVFETTAEGIMVLDPSFRITTVNPAFTNITGYGVDEVMGRPPRFLTSAMRVDNDLHETIWDSVRRSGRWDHEQWSRRKNGEEYAERLSVTAISDDRGRVVQYVVVFSDITQRKLDEERIRYQANYDSLTALPNRSLFMDRLTQALGMAERTDQRLGLMFLDLDGFKLVNDTLGHDLGDELLKEAAKRLLSCVRHGDTVARLGGDEFTVIMPNLGEVRNAPVIAQRMIETLELPFVIKTHEAFVSASIGITVFPDDAADAGSLLKNADAAMYRAKEQGKANFQFFTADLNAQVSERVILKNGLSKALEREEFMLYYQPKCELATGRLTGVEALLRWRSNELGMISPVKFIPVMEETGLIGQVGEWAIEVACEQHKLWREAGHPHMRVAVNLSVRQLRQANLAKTIEDILVRTGVEPSGIELEITESMIMKDTENAVAVLRDLHDMGINLAMDDFGTGYSSLSYLKRFPLHTIKIDRSFINDIATDPDDLEIIRTIISMGHSLRRRIVAEGVETEEQRVLLRKLRCDEMQGYLLSPPVPPDEIDRMLASTRHADEV